MVFRKEIRIICSLLIIVIYNIFINYTLNNILNKALINILFWILMGGVLFTFGKVRYHGKLKYKGYYLLWMFVAGVLYVLTYFSSGFIDGFGRTLYDTSLKGVALNFFYLGSVILLKEWVRFYLINSVQKKFSLYFGIGIVLVFSLLDINLVTAFQVKGLEAVISYLCSSILPVIAFNSFLTLCAYLAGFGAAVIYALVVKVPLWILPILPNSKWITLLLVGTFIPIIGMVILRNTHKSKTQRGKKRSEKEENPYGLLLTATLVVFIVWFSLRIFPLYPTVIASDSMYPKISRGDMVVLLKEEYDELQINDIIEYQLEDIRVVHRIIDIQYLDGDTYFTTQGDANQIQDAFLVSRQQYLGTLKTVIPYIGYPTLIINIRQDQDHVETGDNINN